jgi:MFS family permease
VSPTASCRGVPRKVVPSRQTLVQNVLPPTSAGRMMLTAFLIDPFGTGLFLAGSAVFFTRDIGLSASQLAVGLSVAGVVGTACTVPVGVAADRWGVRRVQVGLHLWRALGLVLYVFVHDFATFLMIAAMVGVGDRCSPPLNQALVALSVADADRTRTMAILRSAKNLAFTLGGAFAVLILSVGSATGYRSIVLVDAATFVVVALIVVRLPLLADDRGSASRGERRLAALRDRPFLAITVVNGILTLHSSLLLTAVPLYLLHETRAPAALIGALFVVNSLLVTLLQVRAGRAVTDASSAGAALRRAGLWLAAGCACLALARSAGPASAATVLLGGVVLVTVGEMVQSAGGWEVSFALAPADRRAQYLSVFGLGAALEGIVGPAVLTWLVVRDGSIGWFVLLVVFAGGGALAAALVAAAAGPAARRPARYQARHRNQPSSARHRRGRPDRRAVAARPWPGRGSV